MATVVFTAVGAIVGGPVGAAIGAVVGSQVDGELFKGGARQGPRVKDLTLTTSAYGAVLPRHFGKMRVGGTVIWATDLVEHSSTSSGKGKPAVTSYSYTSSFAVALASRPILGVGRIWADGKLLRGAAGDLKVGGTLRVYTGSGEQAVDPLIASAVNGDYCPAFRGTAYVVFEGLQLADYGNRIPSLNFEVFCDDRGLSLSDAFSGALDNVDADVPLDGILGFSCEGPLVDTLAQFGALFPVSSDANGSNLTISRARLQAVPIAIGGAAISGAQGDFGGKAGYTRKRAPVLESPPQVLRYYDVERDYQPGSQRGPGRASPGKPSIIELPASLASGDAFRLIANASRNVDWAREIMAWRCAELHPEVGPGAIVTLEGIAGRWRVTEWEWRNSGVELTLERVPPDSDVSMSATSAGQANLASDLTVTPTALFAYELPMLDSAAAAPALYAAVSSRGAGWAGAALYVDAGDGALVQIGTSGRERATIGTATGLAPASSTLIDRTSRVTVQLLDAEMALANATISALAQGANRALIGGEIIQFGKATPLGGGQWRLEQLLRGRGGTEAAIVSHAANEPFVLLDLLPVALDASKITDGPSVRIAAIGLADAAPVESAMACRGLGTRPLAPVHGHMEWLGDGSVSLTWTRRARGAWLWLDGVEVPLQEEREAYQVGFGPLSGPVKTWLVSSPVLAVPAETVAGLRSSMAGGALWVRQIGTYALSDAMLLGALG